VLPVVIATDSLAIGRLVIRNGVDRDGGTMADIIPVEIGPVLLRGELVAGDLRFESLQAELYGLRLDAAGTFGTGEPFALDARVAWQFMPAPAAPAEPVTGVLPPPGSAPVTGSGKVSGHLAELRFEQVVRVPSLVSVGGVARLLQDEPALFAEARWKDVERPLGAGPAQLLRSESGTLRLRGWTDRYTGDADATLRLGDRPAVRIRATAEGDTGQVSLPDIRLDGFGGRVAGRGGWLRGQRRFSRRADRGERHPVPAAVAGVRHGGPRGRAAPLQ
jgi:hypothetical protein